MWIDKQLTSYRSMFLNAYMLLNVSRSRLFDARHFAVGVLHPFFASYTRLAFP